MQSLGRVWKCGSYALRLDKPAIMAIINVTPDSFSGDGVGRTSDAALRVAERALEAGAQILDVGGESSRPGASAVSVQEELDRVIPAVERVARLGVPVSIDTVKPEVMREAVMAGASIINDINALRAPGALEFVAQSGAGVCLMHMRGEPGSMQVKPEYDDVLSEVQGFLSSRCAKVELAGIDPARVVLDPGFGFGKSIEHNLELFRALPKFCAMGFPVLVGVSRKSMLGHLCGREVNSRVYAGVAAAIMAAQRGVSILRVHDVEATRDALAVWSGIELKQSPSWD